MNKLTSRIGITFLLASAGAAGMVACSSDDDNTSAPVVDSGVRADVTTGTQPTAEAGLPGQDLEPDGNSADSGPTLNDNQIFEILHVSNMGEVAEAKMAESMATTTTIKNLAADFDMMHTMADSQLTATATQDNITAADSSPQAFLENATTMDEAQYASLSKNAFDQAYFTNQLTAHTQVLNYINTLLLPQVKDAGLKAQVMAAQTMVSMHLAQLKALELDGGGFDAGPVTDAGDGGDSQ